MGRNNRSNSDRSTDETSHRLSAEMVEKNPEAEVMEDSDLSRIIAVEEFEDVTDTDLISAAIEVDNPSLTSKQTATVQVVITNISPHPLRVEASGMLPLSEHESIESQPGLLLLPKDDHDVQRSLHCWQPTEEPTLKFDEPTQTKLKQGEDIRRTYEVWSHHLNDSCFPLGEYKFKDSYVVNAEKRTDLDWSFTLSVKEL